MQQVVHSIAQHSAADGETVAALMRACRDTVAEIVRKFEAAAAPFAAAGSVEGTCGVCGIAEAGDVPVAGRAGRVAAGAHVTVLWAAENDVKDTWIH